MKNFEGQNVLLSAPISSPIYPRVDGRRKATTVIGKRLVMVAHF